MEAEKEEARKLEERTGIPFLTTSSAVVSAFTELGIEKVSVATPYPEWINNRLSSFLEDSGFEIVTIEGLKIEKRGGAGELAVSTAYRQGKSVDKPTADCLFISSTNWRTIDVIESLERDIGKPVVTSNQATFWAMLKTAKVSEPMGGTEFS